MSSKNTMRVSNYIEMCKPRVVVLMLLTAAVAMWLASTQYIIDPLTFSMGLLGIGLVASAGGAVNQIVEKKIDSIMRRTQGRPVASGQVFTHHASYFAALLFFMGFLSLALFTNYTSVFLTLIAFFGYAFIYTIMLKRNTAQNIVVGGLFGALPPLLGWTAVTGSIDPLPCLLVLIIFLWTPPHFWSLCLEKNKEYSATGLPMLPVIYGVTFSKKYIVIYTIMTFFALYLGFILGFFGWIYFYGISILNVYFSYSVFLLCRDKDICKPKGQALRTFYDSIHYLGLIFLLILVDYIFR